MTSNLAHWNLQASPYRRPAEPYPAPAYNEAVARIEYLAAERRALGALVAATGMGKSTALVGAAAALARSGRLIIEVDALGVSSREILWQITCGLEGQPGMGDGVSRLWQRLNDLAVEQTWRQRPAVILIDDVGQAGPDLYSQLVRLTRVAAGVEADWTLLLAATPGDADRWPESLREVVDLRIDLYRWDEETTVDYLQHALLSAGRFEPVFTEDALRLVHRLAEGLPRQVARLANSSLLAGASAEVAIIDTGIVEAAYDQAAWPLEVAC